MLGGVQSCLINTKIRIQVNALVRIGFREFYTNLNNIILNDVLKSLNRYRGKKY